MHADDLLPGDTPLRLIDQDGGNAASPEFVGQHEPARAAACNQHRGLASFQARLRHA